MSPIFICGDCEKIVEFVFLSRDGEKKVGAFLETVIKFGIADVFKFIFGITLRLMKSGGIVVLTN